jgi:hypothetical protein
VEFVSALRQPLHGMAPKSKRAYISNFIHVGLGSGFSSQGQKRHEVTLRCNAYGISSVCVLCANAFCNIFEISPRQFTTLVGEKKCSTCLTSVGANVTASTPHAREVIVHLAQKFKIPLEEQQIQFMLLSNTSIGLELFTWMADFINKFGDLWPCHPCELRFL